MSPLSRSTSSKTAGRRATCGRRRAQQRPGREPGSPAPLPGARAGRAGGASTQLRNMATVGATCCRGPAVRTFRTSPSLQQAGARVGMSGTGGRAHHNSPSSARRSTASPTQPVGHGGGPRCARRSRARYRTCRTGDRSASPSSTLPGDDPELETTSELGALITRSSCRRCHWRRSHGYRKARERASYAFAIGSVAAASTSPTASCATSGSRSAPSPRYRGGPTAPSRRCAAGGHRAGLPGRRRCRARFG